MAVRLATMLRKASSVAWCHRRTSHGHMRILGRRWMAANPFPEFGQSGRGPGGPSHDPFGEEGPDWFDEEDPTRPKAQSSASSRSPKKVIGPSNEVGDFVLGLSVRRHLTGYALLSFKDLSPLQFGLINMKKATSEEEEVQKKALEVAAVLRDLRETAPQKLLRQVSAGIEEGDDEDDDDMDRLEDEFARKKQWRWVIAVDDSTVDRSPPTNARDNQVQKTVAMLQGLIIADCKRLFKSAPQLVHPRRSRLLLGIRGVGPPARKQVFDIATSEVPDFPVLKHRSGILSDDSLLMSDAWASARFAQRIALLSEKRNDQQLMAKLRKEALGSKQLRKIVDTIGELHPRRESSELSDVLETRVSKMIDEKLNKILDEEGRNRTSQRDF
eukprot:TRINITY_DN109799_c0_g1_i1.p1 TRINITY_DN109799_c0_g1~~TRINITY_DN109799_c0_g1_i1.p1  ORF type:complete len:385 (-),score=100.50 TRINITY_DN109799_c0_g1_i1:98-1252(-)